MVLSNSIFRTAEPTEPRLLIDLPCVIQLAEGQILAAVYNISYGGIAVRLAAAQNTFDLASLKAISVPEIGDLEVESRWRKADEIGFCFKRKREVRPLLDAYFTRTGKFPD